MKGGTAMNYKNAPQIFHDKEDKPKQYVIYPIELFSAINTLFSGNEAKVLLALLGCKGDGSFSPSTKYMLGMTGISQANHFHTTRKSLTKKKYIEEQDGDIYIDTTKILEEYRERLNKRSNPS